MHPNTILTHNEAIVRRLFAEFHNGGDDRVVDEVLAGQALRQQMKQAAACLRRRTAKSHFAIDDLIVAGDKVITRWTAQVWINNRPTRANGLFIYRIRNGKVVGIWQHWDALDEIMH